MTVVARDLKNNDTTDAGFDLLTDPTVIGAVTGDAGITRILFGSSGVDGGFAQGSATDGMLVNLGSNNDVTVTGTVTVDTELPAAAALADNASNPTTVLVGSCLLAFDGTAWDRVTNGGGVEATALRVTIASDSTGVLSVDDNGGSLTVDGTVAATQSGTWNVTNISGTVSLPTGASTLTEQQTQTTALQLIDDIVYTDDTSTHATGTSKGALIMGAATPTDAAVNANDIGAVAMSLNRELHVSVQTALPTGTNNIGDMDVLSIVPGTGATNLGKAEDAGHTTGDVGVMALAVRTDTQAARAGATDDYIPLTTDSLGNLYVRDYPQTTGGLSISRDLDADETETEAKSTAGLLYGYYFANTHATSWRYLKFYNADAATVVVGTTTPVLTLALPPSAAGHVEFSKGITFGTAICYAVTTGVADNDTGAPGANECVVNVFYK